jgi:hypothetical protein
LQVSGPTELPRRDIEEFDQAVGWLQSGGFVTENPREPSVVRLITITHKGMICGEQYDGDVTKIPYGP